MKKIKTAFILAAGLGLRLRPLTEKCPKPLLPIRGRPMITHAMDHLMEAGIERFIVNTHHCAEAYERTFPDHQWRGMPIRFRFEPVLLDTAGGLKNIEDLWDKDEAIIVYNGDILTDMPLLKLIEAHENYGDEVTLALRSDGPLCNVALDDTGRICDMRNLLGCQGAKYALFTGIYIVKRPFLLRLKKGAIESVVPVFVEMLRERAGSVGHVFIDDGYWHDIGSISEYQKISEERGRAS
jgi:NDP-sugar pyrophosphorylase family protein